jgi:hypothetical protein
VHVSRINDVTKMMHNGNNNNNISMAMTANRVEQIYDVMLGVGCVVFSILALANLFIMIIKKFVEYYSRQVDRIVMDESFDDDSCCGDSDDDDSTESDYSEYSESESSECSESCQYDDIKLSPYVPPRRSERLAENRARCNSPLLICRLKFD